MPRERIVVADDVVEIRELCQRVLEAQGYRVHTAQNGEEAIAIASEHPVDLLITDLRMPRLTGLDAYRRMREFRPDLLAIVMTGYGTMDSAIEALKLGAYEFLLKPFSPRDLLSAVERTLSRRRLELQNARLKAFIPLFDLGQVSTSADAPNTLPQRTLEIAYEETAASRAVLVRIANQQRLVLQAAIGGDAEQAANALNQTIANSAMLAAREPILLDQAEAGEWGRLLGNGEFGPGVVQPLVHRDQLLGFIAVARQPDEPAFTQDEVEFLSVLGSQAAIAFENSALLSQVQSAYERLAEMDHLKSEFISIAAHELRTPLAVILAYAALLEEEATGAVQEHLGQVVVAAMQLKSIIDEMVSLRRIDTGEQQIELTPISLAEVTERVLQEQQPLIHQKNHTVVVEIPDDAPAACADEQVVALILSNLISNAIKFTPAGGTVRIQVTTDADAVVYCIRDTGVGIPPDQLERVFERFYQVEPSLRRRHGGIGLGLSIAREMADLVDGRIWAESPLDGGAAFYLSLPQA